MNPHAALGVSNSATEEEITKAYRRLAMQHHPDRGGNEEDFKRIQSAYETLQATGFKPSVSQERTRSSFSEQANKPSWTKPEAPGGTWRDRPDPSVDDILNDIKKGWNRGPRKDYSQYQPGSEIVANVTMREAFSGFNMQVSARRTTYAHVNIPPGTPDGHRRAYQLSDGSYETIITRINPGEFKLHGLNGADNLFSAGLQVGDIEVEVPVDAIDLITGAWIQVKDFLDESMTVRVPAGFNPLHRLKVANKGYYGWSPEQNAPILRRRDMYIRLLPAFKKPEEIDRAKILALYNTIQWDEEDASE